MRWEGGRGGERMDNGSRAQTYTSIFSSSLPPNTILNLPASIHSLAFLCPPPLPTPFTSLLLPPSSFTSHRPPFSTSLLHLSPLHPLTPTLCLHSFNSPSFPPSLPLLYPSPFLHLELSPCFSSLLHLLTFLMDALQRLLYLHNHVNVFM